MRSNGEGETRNERQEEEKRVEGGEKPISLFSAGFFCLVFLGFFFALTLKDTSVLMSQKALNNTTDQYISRLMGFSRGGRGGSRVCSVSCTHANSQKRKGIENSPERSHTGTHQSTMWHMAASSTAESVKRQMEQWEAAHLRTNYDIVFSFAKSRGVDLNYGASSPALPFVLPQVFLSFFFPAGAALGTASRGT